MIALQGMLAKTRPLIERLDALSLRERVIIFGAGVALVFIAWQTLLMDPLASRAKSAQQHLADVRQQATVIDQIGTATSQDPAVAAGLRNRALSERLTALDRQINSTAQGYVAPQRMNELLRALLAQQRGLRLISLSNLPVESLSHPEKAKADGKADGKADNSITAGDRGPFLHPVEIVVEGDYASVVAYLRAVEGLPWRIHWRKLDLAAGQYPANRVTLVIGALSLSPDWMSV
jgi:MSHA biogenesis protein MshJ